MKKCIPTFLATMISSTLYSQHGVANDFISQCDFVNVPVYDRSLMQGNTNNFPITINADYVTGNYPDKMIFTGNVDLNQGNSHLQANELQLHQKYPKGITNPPIRTIEAIGNVRYDDNRIILEGHKGLIDLNTKDINIWEGKYQIINHPGRGKAKLIEKRGGNRFTILENGSFTSCPPADFDTWSIIGSKIIHDNEDQVIKIWNARFKIGSIPLLYSPYLKLPVGDKRRSGFLIPNAKYGTSNHFEFYLPYYWNIASNVDATITPHYIHKRGNIMWENELRYLNFAGTGLMEFSYLPLDKFYANKHRTENDHHRWLYYWQHTKFLDQAWRFRVDYTKTSDPTYLNDFKSKHGSSTDSYATQIFDIDYSMQNFWATLSTKKFQVFSQKLNNNSYAAAPQLDINWSRNGLGPFNLRVNGQVVHFVNINPNMPESTRFHLEPIVNIPWYNDWASVNFETKFMATHYQQKNIEKYNKQYNSNLETFVNRALPQFKIDSKIMLERNINWMGNYIQLLEPHIQYIYVPYIDQSRIQNYDSSFLQFDYSGLFRDRTYGGFDRIASANYMKTGVTTRIYNKEAVERFNISLGQIYYFSDSRTYSDKINWQRKNKTGSLVWAGDIYWNVADFLGFRGDLQYDARLNDIATSSSTIEFFRNENRLAQLNYCYVSSKYIMAQQDSLSNFTNRNSFSPYSSCKKEGISQFGITASWSIVDRYSIAGSYYYNINKKKSASKMLGVQYNSCCYAIRLSYEHKSNGLNAGNIQNKYDNVIGFNVELRGLSSGYDLSTQKMLRSNVLPYHTIL